jgi:DNA-directed RNA polymerase subunit RPC12/RpoP
VTGPHAHLPHITPTRGIYECSHCKREVSEANAITGEYSCSKCNWRAVIWVACSRQCMAHIQTPRMIGYILPGGLP